MVGIVIQIGSMEDKQVEINNRSKIGSVDW